MLSVTPSSVAFTAGTAASQSLTLAVTDSNPVSISCLEFPPGYTAQHPRDDQLSAPFSLLSPIGDGTGFYSIEIIPGRTVTVPVSYSGTGTGSATIRIVYNGVGGIYEVDVPVTAS